MADQMISELTALTTPADADVIIINDADETPPNLTKKITWAYIKSALKTYFHTVYSSQIILETRDGVPATTAGCGALTQVEIPSNKQNIYVCAFDAATDENIDFTKIMPSDWDGGTVTAQYFWAHNGGSAFVVEWACKARAYADGDAADQAWGAPVITGDTGGTSFDIYISPVSSAITIAGSPAGGRPVIFRIYRDANHASDTLDVDALLLGVIITYTRS